MYLNSQLLATKMVEIGLNIFKHVEGPMRILGRTTVEADYFSSPS
jgi:hypothetical protein